jgi:excisionase family DNA binding protein
MEILLHSKRESARLIGVSERTLHKLIATKELEVRRVGRRVLVPHAELLKFIRSDHSTREKQLADPEPRQCRARRKEGAAFRQSIIS